MKEKSTKCKCRLEITTKTETNSEETIKIDQLVSIMDSLCFADFPVHSPPPPQYIATVIPKHLRSCPMVIKYSSSQQWNHNFKMATLVSHPTLNYWPLSTLFFKKIRPLPPGSGHSKPNKSTPLDPSRSLINQLKSKVES